MSYRIASFNVCNMGRNTNRKNWDVIANIIRSESYDIVALQEVLCEGKTLRSQLLPRLGSEWRMEWDTPNKIVTEDSDDDGSLDPRGEGYAYIWNSKRFQLVTTPMPSSNPRVSEPRILNRQGTDVTGVDVRQFFRIPYYARFEPCTPGSKPFIELRLVNAHLFYGSLLSMDVNRRKREFDMLVREVLPGIEDHRYGNSRVAYTIVMGDYNFNLDRPWNRYPMSPLLSAADEHIVISDGKWVKEIRTAQEGMTTLKMMVDPAAVNRGKDYKKSYRFKNNYDHFSYNERLFREHGVSVHCSKVDAIRKYCGNDFDKYRAEVSDHVPIVFEMSF